MSCNQAHRCAVRVGESEEQGPMPPLSCKMLLRKIQGVQDLKNMDMSSELKGSKETHTHQRPNSPWVSHSIRYRSWLLTSPTPEKPQKLELAH